MNNSQNIFLCSFASPDLTRSVKRFKNQAKEMNIYEDIKVFGFNELTESKKKQIKNFKKKKKNRLFGYGCWKPEIISNYLKEIPKNAILQYSDIGCHLNYNGVERLKDYVLLTQKRSILGFQYKEPDFKKNNYKFQIYYEREYSKGDLFKYFDLELNNEIVQTEQFMSGVIFFKNDETSNFFLNRWNMACNEDYLIDDENSKMKNHKDFIEHRHDQSVFSILCKLNHVSSISASEIEWAEDNHDKTWKHLDKFPILARRDKKYNLLKRFINRQKRNIRRFLNKCSI